MKKSVYFILALSVLIILGVARSFSLSNDREFIYLSDIPYIADKSFAGNGNKIKLDENNSDQMIMLNVEGVEKPFIKGVTAWSTSEIIYDLSSYDYDYFVSYLGVDASEKNTYYNTGVKFFIYTSNDKDNWGEPVITSDKLDASTPSMYVKVDIKDVKYLKLVADDNSDSWWSAWYDEAVYADAKLIKDSYKEDTTVDDFIKTVDEYDIAIKNYYNLNENISGNYELTLLRREFVNNIGYDVLQAFVKVSDDYKNIVLWLMNDVENLNYYLIGGTPDGSYINSLKILSQLYNKYHTDLENNKVTDEGVILGNLYKRMMISLSLTHSADVGLWVTGTSGNPDGINDSNAIDRYAIFKKLHNDNLLDNDVFENLQIEEMRFVMNNIIDDEEIEWLNAYSRENGSRNPYSYITYGFGYDYYEEQYYSNDNYEMWDKKYNLSKYNISYKQNYPKLWVVFEEGGVCGAISKTGSNLHGSFGVPSSVVGQPGHAAYIYYSLNENKDGVWNLYNDVSGWAQSSRTEKLSIRMPNGWGIGSYASAYPVTYILLAQANLNDFKNYQKSEQILMLEKTYVNDANELYNIYNKALEVNPLNFDAWLGLANISVSDSSKKESDYLKLAEDITNNLKYYPLPMYDLLRILEPKIVSNEALAQFSLLLQRALTEASQVSSDLSIQQTAVKQVANYLLGNIDSTIATFSFDGEDAGKIVLSEEKFGTSGVAWDYSLDGKKTFNQASGHKHKLNETELNMINETDDLIVHIIGTDYSEDNFYTIDITKATLPTNLYGNDKENKIVGDTANLEWRFATDEDWKLLKNQLPDLNGNKAVSIRVANTGTVLASDDALLFFTEDIKDDKFSYVSIDRLSIEDVSTEEPGRNEGAISAIDGNINTMWHTLWNGSDNQKFITIKLDKLAYISKLEYYPRQDTGNNGKVTNAMILISEDGENWVEAVTSTNWDLSKTPKEVIIDEPIKGQYIKIIGVTTSGNYMSAALINLYEDITLNDDHQDPEEPNVPDVPDAPEEPDQPVIPDEPVGPEEPVIPDTPTNPDNEEPNIPNVPDNPEVDKPVVPGVPNDSKPNKPSTPDKAPDTDSSSDNKNDSSINDDKENNQDAVIDNNTEVNTTNKVDTQEKNDKFDSGFINKYKLPIALVSIGIVISIIIIIFRKKKV